MIMMASNKNDHNMNITTAPKALPALAHAWTPDAAAAHIADLIAETSATAADMRRTPPSEHCHLLRGIDALHCQIAAERYRCAEAFGDHRGWRLSEKYFSPAVLARRGVRSRPGLYAWPYPAADHAYLYHTPDRRAAGAVCHIYGLDEAGRADCRRWAAAQGLRVEFPSEPASWWWPGATTLVLYLPAGAGGCAP